MLDFHQELVEYIYDPKRLTRIAYRLCITLEELVVHYKFYLVFLGKII